MNKAQEFSFEGWDIKEIRALRDRCQLELTSLTEKAAEIKFTEFKFVPPDDRSYGRLSFTVETTEGIMTYKSLVGHGCLDEVSTLVDGSEDPDFDLDGDKFGSAMTKEDAREVCADAVAEWVRGGV